LGKRPQAKPCEVVNGVVAEGEETIEDFDGSAAIDTGLVAAGQAVEHYEMARYGAPVVEASRPLRQVELVLARRGLYTSASA
jgi:ferritin-like metal-binding protein YciE